MKVQGTKQITKNLHKALLGISLIACAGISSAAITSGTLVIYNALGYATDDGTGSSASPVKVVVADATGACSTSTSIAYGGLVTIAWSDSFTHSTTKCNTPTKVSITALKPRNLSTVQYDSTANGTPPATATTIDLVPPTTIKSNELLIIKSDGTGNIENAAAANAWSDFATTGFTATKPVYDADNGALTTTGIPGVSNTYGIRAAEFMHAHGIIPSSDK